MARSFRSFFKNLSLSLLVYFAFLSSSLASSSYLCQSIFSDVYLTKQLTTFGLVQSDKPYTPVDLIQYSQNKKKLFSTLENITSERREELKHLLDAIEFYDYQHTAPLLSKRFFRETNDSFDFKSLYKVGLFGPNPFLEFIKAREYLIKEHPPVTPELLLEIHKRIMDNGIEGTHAYQLGVWRNAHWIGNATGPNKVTPAEVKAIEANPYLYFTPQVTQNEQLNKGPWLKVKIWLNKLATYLDSNETRTVVEGKIHYPNFYRSKPETLEIIKQSHPEIYAELIEARKMDKTQYMRSNTQELEAKFTKALVENRFARFQQERAQLGAIELGKNEHKYIALVADFQRDLVSIHPLLNGNGRSTRLLLNYLLTSEGLPPVRLLDPFLDVQRSREEWVEMVHKGVLNTAQLYKDLAYRIENNLPIENSPELIYPGIAETVSIALKKQGSTKGTPNYSLTTVDSHQFTAFVKTMVSLHPSLRTEIENNRMETLSKLADLFTEFYKSKTIRYLHEKDGEAEIALRLVDPDFIASFGIITAQSPAQWKSKISRWYSNQLVWRGLSNSFKELSTDDLLTYFKQPSFHLASNRAVKSSRTHVELVQAIKNDFETYNKELIEGNVLEMAMDHHRSGPLYSQSYGFSTSKREVVGKAFAMGAMVVGEYGKHTDPGLQARLKSRINIATYRAAKDMDLGRLKAFEESFSYKYGRQAEVMGIGGVDPDAVVLIQRIDAKGQVIETLYRNPEKPNEILIIKGRFVPGETPLENQNITGRRLL
ncbi:MAG: Fic family protein [Bdellovibrionia bacterium]